MGDAAAQQVAALKLRLQELQELQELSREATRLQVQEREVRACASVTQVRACVRYACSRVWCGRMCECMNLM